MHMQHEWITNQLVNEKLNDAARLGRRRPRRSTRTPRLRRFTL